MNEKTVSNVTILGAGIMGAGIGQLAAGSGFNVKIFVKSLRHLDDAERRIEKNLNRNVERGRTTKEAAQTILQDISFTMDLEEAVNEADMIIEAITESMELKKNVWAEASKFAGRDTVLATNTSSLSITELSEAVIDPRRFLGMHFFNPPTRMRLVEVIPGNKTNSATLAAVESVARRMGKTTVRVKKDVAGFIVNRVLISYINEAAKLLETGEYSLTQIDGAMQHGAKMPLGPFMLADLIGLDIIYNILRVFEERFSQEYAPARSIVSLNDDNMLGRKTSQGFYDYSTRPSVSEEDGLSFDTTLLLTPMFDEAHKVVQEGIADKEDVDKVMKLGANFPMGPFEWKKQFF